MAHGGNRPPEPPGHSGRHLDFRDKGMTILCHPLWPKRNSPIGSASWITEDDRRGTTGTGAYRGRKAHVQLTVDRLWRSCGRWRALDGVGAVSWRTQGLSLGRRRDSDTRLFETAGRWDRITRSTSASLTWNSVPAFDRRALRLRIIPQQPCEILAIASRTYSASFATWLRWPCTYGAGPGFFAGLAFGGVGVLGVRPRRPSSIWTKAAPPDRTTVNVGAAIGEVLTARSR